MELLVKHNFFPSHESLEDISIITWCHMEIGKVGGLKR